MAENTGANLVCKTDSGFWSKTAPKYLNYLVLVLSLLLIAIISWDTYTGLDFLEDAFYMRFQFCTCLVFIVEFFYRLAISRHKTRFFFFGLPFLFISIPYLNIIEFFQMDVSRAWLIYFCFIPILRGLVALIMVVTYVTANFTTTVFMSYTIVLVPIVYMGGLLFYIAEKDINHGLVNLWYGIWWSAMTFTTVGCDINPLTATGMILGFIISLLGIIMLPLFTVYFGDMVKLYSDKVKAKKIAS